MTLEFISVSTTSTALAAHFDFTFSILLQPGPGVLDKHGIFLTYFKSGFLKIQIVASETMCVIAEDIW